MTLIFTCLAGLIHLYIFCLESLLWGKPKTNRVFAVSPEMAEANRLFAFNQGFYNLFLALAVFAGLGFGTGTPQGRALVAYGLASMLMAALVLIYSNRRLYRAVLIQGVPPFIGLFCLGFL